MRTLVLLAWLFPAALANAQQQPPNPNPNNRPPILIPIPFAPRTPEPRPAPRPLPPPTTGIDAPKKKTESRPNPAATPGVPTTSESSSDMSDWTKVAPSAAGFAAYMPLEPDERKSTIKAGQRDLNIVHYVLELDEGAFVITCSDLPPDRTTDEAVICRNARDRVVESLKGQLLSESRIVQGDTPGMEIIVQTPGGTVVRQRMFAGKNRFYQAIAAGSRSFVRAAETDKYLRSFRVRP
jgi:hypothetical protein